MGAYRGAGAFTGGGGSGGGAASPNRVDTEFLIASAPANATTAGNYVTGNTNYPFFVATRDLILTGLSAYVNSNPAGSTAFVRIQVEGAPANGDTTLQLSVPVGTDRTHFTTGTGIAIPAGSTVRAVINTDASWTATAMVTTVFVEMTEA